MLLTVSVVTTAAADCVSTAHGPATYGTATRTAAPADGHVTRRRVNARAARALGPTGEMRGIALNDVGGERLLEGAIPAFPRLAAEGVTSVTVYIYLYVASPTGSTVTTTNYTATDAELQLVAEAAHANGLDLHLAPVLNGFPLAAVLRRRFATPVSRSCSTAPPPAGAGTTAPTT